ncbi:MAG TPA: type II secretion system protein [Fimbriimonadaceae bacterium]|nr:type II secretion system protein [Fimbriimonadaceae bacterium]
MNRKNGFSLIELLVVIAIIGILAAIIFPVFMRAKDSAYRAGDLSNLNAIRNALQLYRADQEAYPPQILGYASYYDPGMTQLIPANNLHQALYPKRIDSINTMKPAYDRAGNSDLVAAHWPNKDPRPLGSAPVKDLNGDGQITLADDNYPDARQFYGPDTYFTADPTLYYGTTNSSLATMFYAVSGYDVGEVKIAPTGTRVELRYALRWTNYTISQGGSINDDPRQLIYSNPPDDTVITWDSWFRDYDGGNVVQREKRDIVLFLGGSARPFDSADINDRSWRVTP